MDTNVRYMYTLPQQIPLIGIYLQVCVHLYEMFVQGQSLQHSLSHLKRKATWKSISWEPGRSFMVPPTPGRVQYVVVVRPSPDLKWRKERLAQSREHAVICPNNHKKGQKTSGWVLSSCFWGGKWGLLWKTLISPSIPSYVVETSRYTVTYFKWNYEMNHHTTYIVHAQFKDSW